MKQYIFPVLFVLIIVLATACTPETEISFVAAVTATSIPTTEPTMTPTMTPTATSEPTAIPTQPPPTATPTPGPLPPAEIFAQVSPAVLFIDANVQFGSGVLVKDGYILTNAHVVWPYTQVRVVFPDGTDMAEVPVAAWDLMADLALLGPVNTPVSSLAMVDGEDHVIGSDVYLIGYPGEVESFPQPTITRGLISRLRQWPGMEITYFQTDAAIAGGQSGGVLVSEMGDVIGISGFSFTEAGFGIVASATDLWPRIEQMMAGGDPAGLGDRVIHLDTGEPQDNFFLREYWDTAVYILNEEEGVEVSLEVTSDNDAALSVVDLFGNPVSYVDDDYVGTERSSLTITWEVPHFVVIDQYQSQPASFQISGSANLVPYHDPDDGRRLNAGTSQAGSLDYPGDIDYYTLDLEANQIVHISIDSILIDPFLTVDYDTARVQEQLWDDNSGGGLFGLNAEMSYQANHSGRHFILVTDAAHTNTGGYILTVGQPGQDSPDPVSPPPRPKTSDSPFGQMALYQGAWSPFTMDYPASWTDESRGCKASACFSDPTGETAWLTIYDYYPVEPTSLAAQVEQLVTELEMWVSDFVLISQEKIVTADGGPAVVLVYSGRNGPYAFTVQRLLYVHQDGAIFDALFATSTEQVEVLQSMIDHCFYSFQTSYHLMDRS